MTKEEINRLVQEILKELPPFVGEARKEVEQSIRLGLETLLKKMDLVSREEYDAQVALLHRLSKQVADLEKRIAEIE